MSGGIDESAASLGVLYATVGYISGRHVIPASHRPDSHATTAGSVISMVGCGSLSHLMEDNPQFDYSTTVYEGMAANLICSVLVGIGERIVQETALA